MYVLLYLFIYILFYFYVTELLSVPRQPSQKENSQYISRYLPPPFPSRVSYQHFFVNLTEKRAFSYIRTCQRFTDRSTKYLSCWSCCVPWKFFKRGFFQDFCANVNLSHLFPCVGRCSPYTNWLLHLTSHHPAESLVVQPENDIYCAQTLASSSTKVWPKPLFYSWPDYITYLGLIYCVYHIKKCRC